MNIPHDELSQNPLYRYDGLPDFGAISAAHVVPAITALIAEATSGLESLEATIEPTWASAVEDVAEVFDALWRAWSPVSQLMSVSNSPELREAHQQVQADVVAIGLRVQQSEPIYRALKALLDADGTIDAAQRRIVEQKVLSAELTGIALEGEARERFNAISSQLSELGTTFSNNLLDSMQAWHLDITDRAEIDGATLSSRQLLAQAWTRAHPDEPAATPEDGPWRITLDIPAMLPVMQHVRHRETRRVVYQAFQTRGSQEGTDNAPHVGTILALRAELAGLVGYENFGELSLATKMASLDEVRALAQRIVDASTPAAIRELAELEALANAGGHTGPLQAWDIAFWSERLRERQFEFTDEQLRPYFPMPGVLNGLFSLIESMFGVTVKPSEKDVPVWHPDVRYYDVVADGAVIAGFFFDPYSRPENKRGGAWMGECQGRWLRSDGLRIPVAYIVCNATPPVGDRPALMTFDEVETLFHEFGHGLQHMLTTVDHADASGISGVEWDAVELPSQFMENWCYHRPTLMGLTGHVETGAPLPDELFDRLVRARTFWAGNTNLRQTHFGLGDIALHTEPDAPERAFEMFRELGRRITRTPLWEGERFLCSFAHIFAGGYAAGYYSYKWAEVLSADAFSAFEEAGLDDPATVAAVGKRFRDTVLSLGGSVPPSEVFRAFRGRDPDPDPLLRQYGLL